MPFHAWFFPCCVSDTSLNPKTKELLRKYVSHVASVFQEYVHVRGSFAGIADRSNVLPSSVLRATAIHPLNRSVVYSKAVELHMIWMMDDPGKRDDISFIVRSEAV